MKIFILFDTFLFRLERNGDLTYLENQLNISKETQGGICLLIPKNDSTIKADYLLNFREENIPLQTNLKIMSERLDIFKLQDINFVQNKEKNVFFFTNKNYLSNLFMKYEFSKIYSFDYLLSKLNNNNISGIIGNNFMYLKQFKDTESLKNNNYYYSLNLEKDEKGNNLKIDLNSLIDQYLENEYDKNIFINPKLEKLKNLNHSDKLNILSFSKIELLLKKHSEMCFNDEYSLYYQSKKIKPIFYFTSFISLIIGVITIFFYTSESTKISVLNTVISELKENNSYYSKNINTFKKMDIIKYHQKINFKYLKKVEELINNYQDIINYEVDLITNKKYIVLTLKTKNSLMLRTLIDNYKHNFIKLNRNIYEIELLIKKD